jgi:hypothetical protein
MLAAFQPFVQFHGALEQQEQATAQQDQVTPEKLWSNTKQRLGQLHDPGQRRQQHQPHQQCQRQADHPRAVALVRRQLVGKDRDEHQVVDAENDLQHDQGCKAHPYRGVSQPFHFRSVSSVGKGKGRPLSRHPAPAPGHAEQVAGRALQLAADRIQRGKADGSRLAGLQDRQVRQGDVDAPGQLGQGHARSCSMRSRVMTIAIR